MLTGLPPFYNQNLHAMYEKILRSKLHYPAYLSSSARGILQALLDRNPKTRLGSGPRHTHMRLSNNFVSAIATWPCLFSPL
jgi:serine/threonine protein kinase